MNRLSALGLVAVVLVGGMALAGPAAADATGTNASSPTFGETHFVVTVYQNGSARWTQRYSQPLTNQTRIQEFRDYANKFNGKETPVYTDFRQRAMGLTGDGSNATGREMQARGFTRDARVTSQPGATGVVEMSFLWTNFTTDQNGGVTVGDAFENGLSLSSDMSLEIEAGPDLSVEWDSVKPKPDASTNGSANTTDSLTYFGKAQFASGQPRVVFTPDSSPAVGDSSMFGSPLPWVVVAVVLAVALGAVVVRRSNTWVFGTSEEPTNEPTETDSGAEPITRGGSGTSEDVGGTDETTPEPAVTDVDLRSDEDRITGLLEANGGRMQQSRIVEETGWSKSKVSMVLSEMAETGVVSKLRVGRENIVSLAGHEPAAAGSPFDEE